MPVRRENNFRRLQYIKVEEQELLKRGQDLARQVISKGRPAVTDFLDPASLDMLKLNLARRGEVGMRVDGGYEGAERQRLVLFPPDWPEQQADSQIVCLEIIGSFGDKSPSHRDYLGALLGLGIRREKLGDILVERERALVFADKKVARVILEQLTAVSIWPVTVRQVEKEQIVVPDKSYREIKASVASLRLDAVAAAGFGLSRSKILPFIAAGYVQLNWRECLNPADRVQAGDVISLRGRGRIKVVDAGGTSRRGRTFVLLHRYV